MTDVSLTATDIAALIDHTLLAPAATHSEALAAAAEAMELGTSSVCISPSMLPLDGVSARITAVCGFPSGKHTPRVKTTEAADAVKAGADEIDMVIDIGLAVAGDFNAVEGEIRSVRNAVAAPTVLKVIIVSAALTDDQIVGCCQAAERAGADFVKTSTGYHPAGGATLHAVRLMADTVAPRLGIKASGGIRDLQTALAMIAAGATRLGVSGTRKLVEGTTAESGY